MLLSTTAICSLKSHSIDALRETIRFIVMTQHELWAFGLTKNSSSTIRL